MVFECVTNYRVDGVLVDPPPVSVRVVEPQPIMRQSPSGYAYTLKRPGARRVVTQWGEDWLPLGSALAVRQLFSDTNPIHTVSWDEPDGSQYLLAVTVEPLRSRWTQAQQGFTEPLIVTMWERAS